MDRMDLALFWILAVPAIILLTVLAIRLAYQVHPIAAVAAAAFLTINYTHYTRKALTS